MDTLPHRIPEPELMEDSEQAQAYAEADFSEPHQAFVEHFRLRFPGFAAGRVVDLGCGPGDVTIRFARAFPEIEILGLDGARAMLEFGWGAVMRHQLEQRLTLRLCYLPDPTLPLRAFDAIISNSLLHHLADPGVLWQAVSRLAKPGAPVLIMDLMRPGSLEEARALAELYAGDAPPVLQRDFHASLLAAYRPEEVRRQLDAAGLLELRVEAISDRHLLVWGTAP